MTMPFSPMGRSAGSAGLLKVVVVAGVLLLPSAASQAQLRLQETATGFSAPVYVTSPSGGDSRLFVVEKAGRIQIFDRISGNRSTFLDINGKVDDIGERGLLGLAFDPNFSSNGHFYVNYIDNALNTIVERYTVSAGNANVANAGSAYKILGVSQPAGLSNHKAGWVGFRPGDGSNLYIATGDGGGSNDPGNNGQNLNSNLGKILRVDVASDGFAADPDRNYTVPTTNPFVGRAGNDEIWAYGLRNPWRNSFDRLNGDFYIADVGQGQREEINVETAGGAGGGNYGWRVREGFIATPGVGGPKTADMIDPLYDYNHDAGQASVTGGYLYRGPISFMRGLYFFGDFNRGEVWSLRPDSSVPQGYTGLTNWTPVLSQGGFTIGNVASFGEDSLGNLYVVDFGGRVMMLVPEPSTYALFAVGLLAVGFACKRGRSSSAVTFAA